MRKAFEIAGYGEEVLIGGIWRHVRAFQYGARPTAALAGVDRIVMLLAAEENLRGGALPMNQRAEDLADRATYGGDDDGTKRAVRAYKTDVAREGRSVNNPHEVRRARRLAPCLTSAPDRKNTQHTPSK